MHCSGEPAPGLGNEVFGADSRMGGHNDFHHAVHTAGGQGFLVAVEHRLERLLGFPLRVLRGQALDFIQGKQHLEVHRLFAPQGAVIVEHGNALGRCDVVLAALCGDGSDKLLDRLARGAVVPGRQWVRCLDQQR
ncbi:hypothetical protein D9M71_256140 [compost metagenome]